jgi:hypothetical protein
MPKKAVSKAEANRNRRRTLRGTLRISMSPERSWQTFSAFCQKKSWNTPFSIGYDPSAPVPDRAWKNFVVAPLDLVKHEAISTSVSRDQDFCSFGFTTVRPSSSNLFYIVTIHWVNFTRRVSL